MLKREEEDRSILRDSTTTCSRRRFLSLATRAAAGALLAACAPATLTRQPAPASPRCADEVVQLVYQDWRTEWFPPLAQRMLARFHETHPRIRVFYLPDPENIEERMLADMQAGTAADVFQGCCTFFPIWAQKGYTLDLRPYVAADIDAATIQDWDPAQYGALFTRDGRQFGLPKYHGALALYYNKDLFDRHRIAYPEENWDHDDYLAAMRLLARPTSEREEPDRLWGSMIDISWDRVQVHVNSWGGHLVDPDDPTRCRLADEEALAAMEWIRARMWDDRVMPSRLQVHNLSTRQAFASRRLAMVEDGSWALKDILSQADFRVGVAPFPAGPARRATLATTDGFGIYAQTRCPDAAWELVKFLTGPDYGRAMAQAHFLQPARFSLVNDWIGYVLAEFADKTTEADLAAFAHGHEHGYSVTAEIFANMADARQLVYAAWDQIFTLGQAPVDQLREVCRQIDASQGGG